MTERALLIPCCHIEVLLNLWYLSSTCLSDQAGSSRPAHVASVRFLVQTHSFPPRIPHSIIRFCLRLDNITTQHLLPGFTVALVVFHIPKVWRGERQRNHLVENIVDFDALRRPDTIFLRKKRHWLEYKATSLHSGKVTLLTLSLPLGSDSLRRNHVLRN